MLSEDIVRSWRYDGRPRDAFIATEYGAPDENSLNWDGREVDVAGHIRRLYPIGAYNWTWREVTPEAKG